MTDDEIILAIEEILGTVPLNDRRAAAKLREIIGELERRKNK